MSRSLVICLILAISTGMTAAVALMGAGFGLAAAFAAYSLAGSSALVVAALVSGAAKAEPRVSERDPAFA